MHKPKYWRGLEERDQTAEFLAHAGKEFPSAIPLEDKLIQTTDESFENSSSRRDFLKVLGFGLTATTLSACMEARTRKAIPYVVKPDDITPGVANWYASTTPEGVPVLVKSREGRPIKLEGNPDSTLTQGGLSAIGHAGVLGLYDEDRLKSPLKGTNPTDWDTTDKEIIAALNAIKSTGGKVRVLSHTVSKPATLSAVNEFLSGFADAQHVVYDPVSVSAIAQSHELNFGKKAIPFYHFDRAEVIVSFSCDFLGTWIDPVTFARAYSKHRDPDGKMSRHLQFESILSTTGAKADLRFPIKPTQQGVALLNLHNKIANRLGKPVIPGVPTYNVAMNGLDKAAADLLQAQGKSLVVCGTNDVAIQQIVNAINAMLGNYGATLDLDSPILFKQGDDRKMDALVGEMKRGEVAFLLVYGANPVYDTVYGEELAEAIKKVGTSVSLAYKTDETSEVCTYTCPDHHYLESWGDYRQTGKNLSLVQPAVNPIFKTRQVEDSFLRWAGNTTPFKQYLEAYWRTNFFPLQATTGYADFTTFWNETLRKGVFELSSGTPSAYTFNADILAAAQPLINQFNQAAEGNELVIYEKVSIGDGKYANNPWLQELPDPITRICWDNYLTVSVSFAEKNGLNIGDVVRLSLSEKTVNVPVMVQPGQANNTFGLALGYGRTMGGKVIKKTGGVNAYPFLRFAAGCVQNTVVGVNVSKTGSTYKLALTQTFNTLYDPEKGKRFGDDYDRSEAIVKETSLAYYKDKKGDNPYADSQKEYQEKKKHLVSLWDAYIETPEYQPLYWSMAIDLNKCTGCGACVVSCNAENNIPVVGKEEVSRRRSMHWLRIDRYYSGDAESPEVVFQPMLCQHCDNAPCETVCPVLATVHSNEGLNQMAYNRCVGTRYCANNCPYKVRRFNWFSYYNGTQFRDVNPAQNELGKLVLNPDVTVRFRGVMEKCSFCVQRLQEAKLRAKVNADSTLAKPEDGAVKTACQQSCPTGAIVFGDRNDRNSEVHKSMLHERSYLVLEEIKTLPKVHYMTLVRNRDKEESVFMEEVKERVQSYGSEIAHS